MDDFELELQQAFERRPAPPSLKRKIMERRPRVQGPRIHVVLWQRLAASVALAAVLGGAWELHLREEQRRGEAAREQVLTALRITGHALDNMNKQLAAHSRANRY
jgi:hypothetical protein